MCNLEVKGCYSIPVQCSSQVVQSNNFLYVCISVYYLRFQICCHTQNWHKTKVASGRVVKKDGVREESPFVLLSCLLSKMAKTFIT